ncbi:MAG: hypothetical protein AAGG02_01235 [Cyanobacteria bacterium P01_H01_bin.15]
MPARLASGDNIEMRSHLCPPAMFPTLPVSNDPAIVLTVVLTAIAYSLLVPPFLVKSTTDALVAVVTFMLFHAWALQTYLYVLRSQPVEDLSVAGWSLAAIGFPRSYFSPF